MTLSRKYYIEFARIMGNPKIKSKGQMINAIADYMKRDNPRFNRERFVKAIAVQHHPPVFHTYYIAGKRFKVK